MFGKKAEKSGEKESKEKKLSPDKALEKKITELTSDQTISYTLIEVYGGGLAIVGLNAKYPDKGEKKYTLYRETLVEGKPGGKRQVFWKSDKPMELSKWILERGGKPFEG